MKTIVITSQKGGSGKTMLAAHLAVEAERTADAPAWLIDTDRQATLTLWHERRKAETPARGTVTPAQISNGLAILANGGASYCFIDTAPTISDQTAALVRHADLVIIPVRPSPSDLWAVGETVEMVKKAGKPFLFVITQAKPQASITAQAVAALSEHGRVAQPFVGDRVVYASAMTSGQTAPEITPRGPAAVEIADLWKAIKKCFIESKKSERKAANG